MPKVTIEDDKQWHELRKRNIGGSDIAALFGASPWMTEFTLYAEKSGITEHVIEENNKMALGRYLEPFIGEWSLAMVMPGRSQCPTSALGSPSSGGRARSS